MVEDIQKVGTIPVLDSSSYKHFSAYINKPYKKPFQKRQTRKMERVNVMERSYEMAISYNNKDDSGKLGRSDGTVGNFRRCAPHVIRDAITITMDEMA